MKEIVKTGCSVLSEKEEDVKKKISRTKKATFKKRETMSVEEVREAVARLAKEVVAHSFEIVANPILVDESVEGAFEVELTDDELLDLIEWAYRVESQFIDNCYFVEEHRGVYLDDDGNNCEARLTKEVEHEELELSYTYDGHLLLFDVAFRIVNYELSKGSCFIISDEEWKEKMDSFREMTEED